MLYLAFPAAPGKFYAIVYLLKIQQFVIAELFRLIFFSSNGII